MSGKNPVIRKGLGINFDEMDPDPAAAPSSPLPQLSPAAAPSRPRTAIGALSSAFKSGHELTEEVERLKGRLAEVEDAVFVEMLDPKLVDPSAWANRHEASFAGEDFQRLRSEIQDAGRNVQPIKVRRKKGGDRFEIVYGHRRHRACLELGIPVAAVVEEVTDQQLFIEMDRENRQRADLAPWEQGAMYKRALDSGLFSSQRKLASELGLQSGNVATAIQLGSLPQEVIDAFQSPLDLQYRWAGPLKAQLEKDPISLKKAAKRLSQLSPRLPAREVYRQLIGGAASSSLKPPVQFKRGDLVVATMDEDRKGAVVVRFAPDLLDTKMRVRLREFLEAMVSESSGQSALP
jgi:ParB family transcriptional regulator, chromosome partitioning protein